MKKIFKIILLNLILLNLNLVTSVCNNFNISQIILSKCNHIDDDDDIDLFEVDTNGNYIINHFGETYYISGILFNERSFPLINDINENGYVEKSFSICYPIECLENNKTSIMCRNFDKVNCKTSYILINVSLLNCNSNNQTLNIDESISCPDNFIENDIFYLENNNSNNNSNCYKLECMWDSNENRIVNISKLIVYDENQNDIKCCDSASDCSDTIISCNGINICYKMENRSYGKCVSIPGKDCKIEKCFENENIITTSGEKCTNFNEFVYIIWVYSRIDYYYYENKINSISLAQQAFPNCINHTMDVLNWIKYSEKIFLPLVNEYICENEKLLKTCKQIDEECENGSKTQEINFCKILCSSQTNFCFIDNIINYYNNFTNNTSFNFTSLLEICDYTDYCENYCSEENENICKMCTSFQTMIDEIYISSSHSNNVLNKNLNLFLSDRLYSNEFDNIINWYKCRYDNLLEINNTQSSFELCKIQSNCFNLDCDDDNLCSNEYENDICFNTSLYNNKCNLNVHCEADLNTTDLIEIYGETNSSHLHFIKLTENETKYLCTPCVLYLNNSDVEESINIVGFIEFFNNFTNINSSNVFINIHNNYGGVNKTFYGSIDLFVVKTNDSVFIMNEINTDFIVVIVNSTIIINIKEICDNNCNPIVKCIKIEEIECFQDNICIPDTGECIDKSSYFLLNNNTSLIESIEIDEFNSCILDDVFTNKNLWSRNCDDYNPCTIDSCINSKCVNKYEAPVNDKYSIENLKYGKCSNYSCNPISGVWQLKHINKNDANPLTFDSCNPFTGEIFHSPINGPCFTNTFECDNCSICWCDPLTGEIVTEHIFYFLENEYPCFTFLCLNGEIFKLPLECFDNDSCTVDYCDEEIGSCVHSIRKPSNITNLCYNETCLRCNPNIDTGCILDETLLGVFENNSLAGYKFEIVPLYSNEEVTNLMNLTTDCTMVTCSNTTGIVLITPKENGVLCESNTVDNYCIIGQCYMGLCTDVINSTCQLELQLSIPSTTGLVYTYGFLSICSILIITLTTLLIRITLNNLNTDINYIKN